MKTNNAYEDSAWQSAPDKMFHPGGLALLQEALAHCELRDGATVLDVGCGLGTTLNYFADDCKFAAYGVDVSGDLLARARTEHALLYLIQAVAEHLPFANERVDAIVAECVLSTFKDRKRALRELARVLTQGGYLIASDVYARYASPNALAHNILTQPQIIEQLSAHGFEIELWQDHTTALREFVAQMIWAGSSFEDFCARSGIFETAAPATDATRKALGYYLLVARKGGVRWKTPSGRAN